MDLLIFHIQRLAVRVSFFLFALLVSGCQFTYLVKSGYHQADLLRSRRPIADVLQDPTTSEPIRRKLQLVQDVRKFAEDRLHLKPTQNYTTYVDLHRDYVTWAVSAAPKDRLEHHLWKYPLVGSLPYKGFFEKAAADEESQSLEAEGFDTYVRGVTAYSTLGWFRDPVLSSMLRSADHDLVNVIIHETVHATLYIKSAADFNERLATFLGDLGTEIFYREREGKESITLKQIELENEDQRTFSRFIGKELEELKAWYQSQSQPSEDQRQARFRQIQENFRREVVPKMKTEIFKGFSTAKINNARLLAFQTYLADLSDFEKAFEINNRDFEKFLKFCKELEAERDPERTLKERIQK